MSARFTYRDGDRVRVVEIAREGDGRARVRVDEAELALEVEALPDGTLRLTGAHGVTLAQVTASGTRRFVRLGAMDFVLERESEGRRGARGRHGGLESPMPGVVTRVMVAPGDAVKRGQPLLALEAMKMEHVLRAPRDGRVRAVAARAGEMVEGGVALVELEESG